jgi:hypothetical protein
MTEGSADLATIFSTCSKKSTPVDLPEEPVLPAGKKFTHQYHPRRRRARPLDSLGGVTAGTRDALRDASCRAAKGRIGRFRRVTFGVQTRVTSRERRSMIPLSIANDIHR